jgi:hypothetical protein
VVLRAKTKIARNRMAFYRRNRRFALDLTRGVSLEKDLSGIEKVIAEQS